MYKLNHPNHRYLFLIVTSLLVIILDQVTKQLVYKNIPYAEAWEVIPGFFDLTHIHNPGAAFGFLAKADESVRVPLFLFLPIFALGMIVFYYRKLSSDQKFMMIGFSLIMGGAIGNLIDRFRLQFVIDFLSFHWKNLFYYPAFNVADSAICIGVTFLLIEMFLEMKQENKIKKMKK